MRIGIVSDIHCNVKGLRLVLEAMGDVDEVLCAGDTVYQYRFSNEVFEIIRARQMRLVLGNHEEVILSHSGSNLRNSGTIHPENLEFMKRTPTVLETRVDGKRLYMVHGSPWDHLREYLYPTSPNFPRLAEIDADFVIMGHTHFPVVKRVGRVLAINAGSCGEARDPNYPAQFTYAVLDTISEEAVLGTVDDPDQSRALGEAFAFDQPRDTGPAPSSSGWEERD